MKIKFEIGKEYKVNYRNGKPAGTLVFRSFDKMVDHSFGVNQRFDLTAEFNGRAVKVALVGHKNILKTAWFLNGNNRYDLVEA